MLISHHRASPQERLFSVYTFSLWTQFCKYQGIASLLLRLISRCYSRLSLYKVLSDWRDKLFPSDFPAVAAKYADNMWTVCSCSAAECSVLQSAVIVSQIMLHAIFLSRLSKQPRLYCLIHFYKRMWLILILDKEISKCIVLKTICLLSCEFPIGSSFTSVLCSVLNSNTEVSNI